jgi:DNA-binding winged helix-turn-helix (wHTH) protein
MQLQPIVPAEKGGPMRRNGSGMVGHQAGPSETDTTLEFGRFRLSTRRRQLLADGAPVELGTRAIDLLMVLIDADGALVTKDELLALVWPDTFVDVTNLKVQVCELRKALGADRDFIRTEFGRGYRFTGSIRTIEALSENPRLVRRGHQSRRDVCRKRTFRRSRRTWRAARSNWPRRATCAHHATDRKPAER